MSAVEESDVKSWIRRYEILTTLS